MCVGQLALSSRVPLIGYANLHFACRDARKDPDNLASAAKDAALSTSRRVDIADRNYAMISLTIFPATSVSRKLRPA